MIYDKPDFYSKKAKDQGYLARSVYKLIEINDKFKLFKKGQRILDLGCAPGSWTQYVSGIVADNGLVVGIDYKRIDVSAKNVVLISGDFLSAESQDELKKHGKFDGIISDMAPDTKGDRVTDCYVSSDLVREALRFSYDFLKKGGFFVAKIFQGGDEKEIMDEMKKAFGTAKWFKPASCRKTSFEIYMIGLDFIKKPEIAEENDIMDLENNDGTMPW